MISLENVSVESHRNIINSILDNLEKKEKFKSCYFMLKRREEDLSNEDIFYSLNKLNFRDEPLLDIREETDIPEETNIHEETDIREETGVKVEGHEREKTEQEQQDNLSKEKKEKGKEEKEKEQKCQDEDQENDKDHTEKDKHTNKNKNKNKHKDKDKDEDMAEEEEEKEEEIEEEKEEEIEEEKEEEIEEEIEKDVVRMVSERDGFSLVFKDKKVEEKNKKKNLKENQLLQKLTTTNMHISDESMTKIIGTLLEHETVGGGFYEKENKFESLQKHYSFYDESFSTNFYLKQEEGSEYHFHLSKQLNGLAIVSLGKYSGIFWDILNYIKGINNSKNLKKIMKENVKIEYNERLMKANVSGKRKRNTICIKYNMVILQISFNDKIYKIKSRIQGLLCDINEQLINDPSILFSDTQEGWLLILKNVDTKKLDSTHIQNIEQYKEENKNFVKEFDTLLSHLE